MLCVIASAYRASADPGDMSACANMRSLQQQSDALYAEYNTLTGSNQVFKDRKAKIKKQLANIATQLNAAKTACGNCASVSNQTLGFSGASGDSICSVNSSDTSLNQLGISFSINSGAASTNSTSVNLSLSCSGTNCSQITQLIFSNDNTTWGNPVNYTAGASYPWTLSSGDGTKTAYVKFGNSSGGWSTAGLRNTIGLNTAIPQGLSMSINNGASSTNSLTVTLSIYCTGNNCSYAGIGKLQFSNDNTTWGNPISYTAGASYPWTLSSGDGTKTVYAKVIKMSDGQPYTGVLSDAILLNTAVPQVFSISINNGTPYSNLTAVNLTIGCGDANCANIKMVQFSNDNINWSSLVNYTAGALYPWTLASGISPGSVAKVYAKVCNQYNICSNPVASNAVTYKTDGDISSCKTMQSLSSQLSALYAEYNKIQGSTTGYQRQKDLKNQIISLTPQFNNAVAACGGCANIKTDTLDFRGVAGNGICPISSSDTSLNNLGISFSINSGDASTNSTSVNLSLSCTGSNCSNITQFKFSNDNKDWSSPAIAYTIATQFPWALTSGNGTKTIYVKFGNSSGGWSTAGLYNTINLTLLTPRLWLKADNVTKDVNSKVSRWPDNSGNGFDVIQTNTNNQPLSAIDANSAQPLVRLDGSNDYLITQNKINLLNGTGSTTVFVVVKPGTTQQGYADIVDYSHSATSNQAIQQSGSSTNQFVITGCPGNGECVGQQLNINSSQVLSYTFQKGSSVNSYLNGGNKKTAQANSALTWVEPNIFTVGTLASSPGARILSGDIAEIIIYNSVLSDADRQGIESRLIKKYVLTVQQRLDAGETPFQIYQSNNALLSQLYGKNYQGGVIAYLNTTDGSGLVARSTRCPNYTTWSPPNVPLNLDWGASGTSIGSGLTNTQNIYNNFQLSNPNDNYAAKYAYTNCSTGSTSDGWFLPSRDEMSAVMNNLIKEDCSTWTDNFGGYKTSTQSTDKTAGTAVSISCTDGSTIDDDMTRQQAVRPVRYFTQ